jgi:predicted nucleic acid-binding Zn finger protein
MSEEKERLRESMAEFAKHGKKFDKALDAVLSGSVKECRFEPSGRKLFTVVGTLGDEFIDPERPYCSCSNFFFRVLDGREDLCYHLLSYSIAAKAGKVDVLEFSDEEYRPYLVAAIGDVFQVLGKSGG